MLKKPTLETAVMYITALDLSYIINKMMHETYALPRWTQEDADKCCQRYKNFLILLAKHPKVALVPTWDIDEFWHNHILYTQRYTEDCLNIFGYYLHHHPSEQTEEELDRLQTEFALTEELYFKEFGVHLRITEQRE
jgi:hypothetical protein